MLYVYNKHGLEVRVRWALEYGFITMTHPNFHELILISGNLGAVLKTPGVNR